VHTWVDPIIIGTTLECWVRNTFATMGLLFLCVAMLVAAYLAEVQGGEDP